MVVTAYDKQILGLCDRCRQLRKVKLYNLGHTVTWLCKPCKKVVEDEAEKEAYKQGGEQ